MGLNPSQLPDAFKRCMDKSTRVAMGKVAMTTQEGVNKFNARKEREVHKEICNWLRLQGIYFVRSRMDKRTTNANGVPDFIFAVKGVPFAVEVKVNGNKLSQEQEVAIAQMQENGWRCLVLDSLPALIEVVKGNAPR